MIPVYQTLTVANDGMGNCFNACMASILELPLREVCDVLPGDDPYWSRWENWLAERGLDLDIIPAKRGAPKGWAIACGFGGRIYPEGHAHAGQEISHAAVVFNGEVIHDPFPGAKVFNRIMHYWVLVAPAAEEAA